MTAITTKHIVCLIIIGVLILLILCLYNKSVIEGFDNRFIYEKIKKEAIDYAGLVGDKTDWSIYKVSPVIGTTANIRYPITFKADELKDDFPEVVDDQGVNNTSLIPYILDILRQQSAEIITNQKKIADLDLAIYEIEKG